MTKKLLVLLVIMIGSFAHQSFAQRVYSLPEGIHSNDYAKDVVILKLLPTVALQGRQPAPENSLQFQQIEEKFPVARVEQLFKRESQKQVLNRRSYNPATDISGIYKLKLQPGEDPLVLINELLQYENVQYAEPSFKMYPLNVPNDPQAQPGTGGQTYLNVIRAYEGWNVTQGDSSIVIGILDSGIDLNHEDLKDNIAYNYDDPVDGVDNDQDGYIDNYHGWDMADHDNDPTADYSNHGTEVAGVSSATTGNNTGMAGLGYHTRFLPVKVFTSAGGSMSNGYEAIVYAADQGCQVINLSWGSANSYSRYGQNIINYAVLEKDAVIVAAAGNTNGDLDFYPASFNHVLSVGASSMNDQKAGWATYSSFIDLMAPGEGVFTTTNGGYIPAASGSSFSSPLVAAAAALVRDRFPFLNALQVAELIRLTTDDIYEVGNNSNFEGKLGKGRLNVSAALTSTLDMPAVRLLEITPSVSQLFYDQQISLDATFINYLNTTENTHITLSTTSPYVSITDAELSISGLETLESSQLSEAFSFYLHENTPANEALVFKLEFEQGNYRDEQYFKFFVAGNRLIIEQANISMDIYSNGEVAQTEDDNGYNFGGLYWKHQKILSHAGLMVGTSENQLVDNLVSDFNTGAKNTDFAIEKRLKSFDNSTAALDLRNVYRSAASLPIRVEQKTLAWEASADSNYLVMEFRLTNLSDSALNEVYAGIFQDWDLGNANANQAYWIDSLGLGYTSSDELMAGMAFLSGDNTQFYAIDKGNYAGNNAELGSTFSKAEKFNFLSSTKLQAGSLGEGNDVAIVSGLKIQELPPFGSYKFTMLVSVGSSLEELTQAVQHARERYEIYRQNPPLAETIILCPESNQQVNPQHGTQFRFYKDYLGNEFLGEGEALTVDMGASDSILYVAKADSAFEEDLQSIHLIPNAVETDFSFYPDTLYLDGAQSPYVTFTDLSNTSRNWAWDFGNGYQSNMQHPVVRFDKAGQFEVQLTATNATGCSETVTKTLVVEYRAALPDITVGTLCKGEQLLLQANNADKIKVYTDEALENLLFEGNQWISNPITTDTSFYVTNADSTIESLARPVYITLNPEINADFDYQILDEGGQQVKIRFEAKGKEMQHWRWTLDGQPVSTAQTAEIDWALSQTTSKTLQLEVWNAYGCKETLTLPLTPTESLVPTQNDLESCQGKPATFSPANGTNFRFYADEQLNELLHAGNTYTTPAIQDSFSVYITNMDSLIESKPLKATVRAFQADFNLSADTLYLNEGKELLLSATNGTSWKWLLPDGSQSREQSLTYTFDKTGLFLIELLAYSEDGCQSVVSKPVFVFSILGAHHYPQPVKAHDIRLYPIPASDHLTIETGSLAGKDVFLRLINTTGQTVWQHRYKKAKNILNIQTQAFSAGIYQIQLISEEEIYTQKIVIEE